MTKIAKILSALALTVAALTTTTFIATSSADAAEFRSQGNGQFTAGARKAQPIQNGAATARMISDGGKKTIDHVAQWSQWKVPAGGFKQHMTQVKPITPANHDYVIKMLKASGPHHMHDHIYNNWYWKVGGYYLDVDYVKYWHTYSYPIVYAVEKEVEVCEIEYKYRRNCSPCI